MKIRSNGLAKNGVELESIDGPDAPEIVASVVALDRQPDKRWNVTIRVVGEVELPDGRVIKVDAEAKVKATEEGRKQRTRRRV